MKELIFRQVPILPSRPKNRCAVAADDPVGGARTGGGARRGDRRPGRGGRGAPERPGRCANHAVAEQHREESGQRCHTAGARGAGWGQRQAQSEQRRVHQQGGATGALLVSSKIRHSNQVLSKNGVKFG